MKVSIKDFQIIKSASLEFLPGLTVIQGESNNGKSALFRAIKSCIYNEPGISNVRVGCKHYVVGIEHNNHKVILQKGENSLYLIDGQQYNKIGKTQVPEVANALGINALSINDNTEKINFWDQMEKPFLLDRNSSELFRFIVDSGEDDNLNTTLHEMVYDKNKLNQDKNLKEGSIATLKEQIDKMEQTLAGSDEKIQLCENIISLGPKMSRVQTINTTITNITNTTNRLTDINNTITKQNEIREGLNNTLNTLSYNISKKEQLNDKITKHNELNNTLNRINEILNNKVDFKKITQELSKIIDNRTKLGEILKKIGEINVILDNKVSKIDYKLKQEEVNKLNTLSTVLNRISYIESNLKDLIDEKDKLQQTYQPILDEYNKIDICPYCGNMLHGKEAKHE